MIRLNSSPLRLALRSLLGSLALAGAVLTSQAATTVYQSSFETGMEGWVPDATDIELGSGTIPWSITRSTDRATAGVYSLKYYLANYNDAGKIWVERGFPVTPGRSYRVTVELQLGTQDYGDLNHFRIIASAKNFNPELAPDLTPFQGETGNGNKNGYVWLPKSYSFKVNSGASSTLWVAVGIWGTFEVPRTYYIDQVKVTISD